MCHDLNQNKIVILCVKGQLKIEMKLSTALKYIQ